MYSQLYKTIEACTPWVSELFIYVSIKIIINLINIMYSRSVAEGQSRINFKPKAYFLKFYKCIHIYAADCTHYVIYVINCFR